MKFITPLLLFVSMATFAQSKTGTIDIDFIITQMPAISSVNANTEAYAKNLQNDLETKMAQYSTQLSAYNSEETSLTQAQKTEKREALILLEADIRKFQQNATQLVQIKKNEEFRPLYNEIGVALDVVAKAQGYTLIMQTNENIVYIDPSTDVTRAVLTQLGITIKQE